MDTLEHQRAIDRRFSNIESVLRAGRGSASDEQKGLLAVRYLRAIANGQGVSPAAIEFVQRQKSWNTEHRAILLNQLKTAISGLSTPDTGGASEVAHDFLAALRPLTIIGRLENLRRIPPRVPVLTQTAGSVAGWRGNGQHRVLSAGTYSRENLPLLSVGAMSVASNELLADASTEGEAELLRDLLAACAEALDSAFILPSNTGITDATPASVTSAATPIYLVGSTIADLDSALAQAIRQLVAAGSNLSGGAWVMSHTAGAALGVARGASGALAYPTVGVNGGILLGLPVLTSASVTPDSDGEIISLLDASQISYAENTPNLSVSRNASIEMSNTPVGDASVPIAAATLVSMFQADASTLLASMAVNWKLRRTGCAQVVAGVPAALTAA